MSHPHLASVHDYGESLDRDGATVPYVVMELLNGPTLTERLACGSAAAPGRAAGLRRDRRGAGRGARARTWSTATSSRTTSCSTPTGAKLVDFGVAAIAGAPDERRPGGKIMGTPNYVAPERLLGGPVVPPRMCTVWGC